MPLESTNDLIEALRVSGLFSPEQFADIVRDLAPFAGDAAAGVNRLVDTDRLTPYQLKKVLHNRAADLVVGPYVITDKLGSGGMGKVYRARDRTDGRTVALKVVRPVLVQNPTVLGRYHREVKATSRLNHPNIVGIFDAGEANGRVYMAMEFVDGIDLAHLVRESGMLAVEEACEYVRQAAAGLHHAHENGFVHRDVKPSNLVVAGERHVAERTEPAVVKVLDLGLARAIDPDGADGPDLTRDHAVVGTPDYMAPEQARNSKLVDARADLYSLGCTLYFLLTGRVPFPYPSAIEKILAHQNEPPPHPLQALNRAVPSAVAGIVARLMAKRPDDRFQTAAELAAALAPHTEYPHGAAPAGGVRVRDRRRGAAAEPSPPPSSASSGRPLSTLGLSSAADRPAEPGPRELPVAPSDKTPRPRGVPRAKQPVAAGNGSEAVEWGEEPRSRLRRAEPAADRLPWLLWAALGLLAVANVAVLFWLLSRS